MNTLKTDTEIKALIPPLLLEERQGLENSLKREGCRDALIVWGDVLIDGHNRYEICKANGIPFRTVQKSFENKDSAKAWVIQNQLARRNLSAYQRSVMALALEDLFKKKAEEHQRAGVNLSQKSEKPIDRYKEIGKLAGVSHDTVAKVKLIQKKATAEQKSKLITQERSINSVYKDIRFWELFPELLRDSVPSRKFRVIHADPPYGEMSLKELARLPVKEYTDRNAVLYIWATNNEQDFPRMFDLISAWGFEYKTGFCWVWAEKRKDMKFRVIKDVSVRPNPWFGRKIHELCFIATRGTGNTPDVKKLFNNIQYFEKGKPVREDRLRDILEYLFPLRTKLEIFPKAKHEGWEAWGVIEEPL